MLVKSSNVLLRRISLCSNRQQPNAYQSVIFSDFTNLGFDISSQKFKEGGLSYSVRSNNGYPRRHVNAEFAILKDILLIRVVEGNI